MSEGANLTQVWSSHKALGFDPIHSEVRINPPIAKPIVSITMIHLPYKTQPYLASYVLEARHYYINICHRVTNN